MPTSCYLKHKGQLCAERGRCSLERYAAAAACHVDCGRFYRAYCRHDGWLACDYCNVEQHLENTVRDYQSALEQAHDIALSGQSIEREIERARQSFDALAELEQSDDLSGAAGRGAVFRVLKQKSEELENLEDRIATQQPLIDEAFGDGNRILARMRELTVAAGPVDMRSTSAAGY